jgi:gamma-glutamyltranspeptidase
VLVVARVAGATRAGAGGAATQVEVADDITAVQAIRVCPAGAVGASDPRKNGARAAAAR